MAGEPGGTTYAALSRRRPRDPALAVDTADDRELLDQKAVVVVAVDRVQELPRHSIHITGDGEQLDPVALGPELPADRLRHHIRPQLRAQVPDPVADERWACEPGFVRGDRAELVDHGTDHLGRVAGEALGDLYRVQRLADQLEAVPVVVGAADLQGDLARLGGEAGQNGGLAASFLKCGAGLHRDLQCQLAEERAAGKGADLDRVQPCGPGDEPEPGRF